MEESISKRARLDAGNDITCMVMKESPEESLRGLLDWARTHGAKLELMNFEFTRGRCRVDVIWPCLSYYLI